MLWALGLGARVAAVSDACDYPPDVVARAKARRSFAAASASSYTSLNQLAAGSAGSTASSTSAAASRRESPLAAQGRSTLSAWQAAAGEPSSIVGGGGSVAQHLEDVVDEEVLARERPGLVVYEEDAAGSCAAASMFSGSPGQGGMGQAVLEALVAVGLQHSCRVVCVRRRTLSDVLDSMLAVRAGAGCGYPCHATSSTGSTVLQHCAAAPLPLVCSVLWPRSAVSHLHTQTPLLLPAGGRGGRCAGRGAACRGPAAGAAAACRCRGGASSSGGPTSAPRAGAALAAAAAHGWLVAARPGHAGRRRLRPGGGSW